MYEIVVFSEILARHHDILEAGTIIFVKAMAQFEGETVRITAQSIKRLNDVNDSTNSMLKIFVDECDSLPTLKKILSHEGKGNGEVILVSRVNQSIEVEVKLPGGYTISPMLAQAVKAIPGIIEVRSV